MILQYLSIQCTCIYCVIPGGGGGGGGGAGGITYHACMIYAICNACSNPIKSYFNKKNPYQCRNCTLETG